MEEMRLRSVAGLVEIADDNDGGDREIKRRRDHDGGDEEEEEEVMLPLPGFRFHPTDEELVGFYLRRKILQRPLTIELIRQLDIYKYDPWDLPKLATSGEKEWYFYCPRDRKYRNSARPNRVTGAGFWKATGTDRPIYSSEGSKCIGLKKSLVFYKGRAAKGVKTDWMMHEFRLPSLADLSSPNHPVGRNVPAHDSWAICRIFKKINSTAQRVLAHSSYVSPTLLLPPESSSSPSETPNSSTLHSQPSPDASISPISVSKTTSSPIHIPPNDNAFLDHSSSLSRPLHFTSSYGDANLNPSSFPFSPLQDRPSDANEYCLDASSILQNMSSSVLGDVGDKTGFFEGLNRYQEPLDGSSLSSQAIAFPFEIRLPNINATTSGSEHQAEISLLRHPTNIEQWGDTVHSLDGLPSYASALNAADAWKSNLFWDTPSCPSDQLMLSTYFNSTTKCYT